MSKQIVPHHLRGMRSNLGGKILCDNRKTQPAGSQHEQQNTHPDQVRNISPGDAPVNHICHNDGDKQLKGCLQHFEQGSQHRFQQVHFHIGKQASHFTPLNFIQKFREPRTSLPSSGTGCKTGDPGEFRFCCPLRFPVVEYYTYAVPEKRHPIATCLGAVRPARETAEGEQYDKCTGGDHDFHDRISDRNASDRIRGF